jgi:hypothetical protein
MSRATLFDLADSKMTNHFLNLELRNFNKKKTTKNRNPLLLTLQSFGIVPLDYNQVVNRALQEALLSQSTKQHHNFPASQTLNSSVCADQRT